MFSRIFKEDTAGSLEDRMAESSVTFIKAQCPTCIHFNRVTATTCAAFPGGIPNAIIIGGVDHSFTYKHDGFDDGGITYVSVDVK